jgi:uncharacterized SAM-dependent methyltransferase
VTVVMPRHASLSSGCLFLRDVVSGLRQSPKQLPCKYFYNQRGSELFDRICQTAEYYLTAVEMQILTTHAPEICRCLGSGILLVEYGCGSAQKTKVLLDHLVSPRAYVPVDISRDHLRATAVHLKSLYSAIEIRTIVFFSGSTIGNFPPAAAGRLLRGITRLCAPGGGLLIGIDLKKRSDILEAAYNDREHVTEQFNLNLLQRINDELGGNFDLAQFRHRAIYEPQFGRMRMSLESCRSQVVTIGDYIFDLLAGEQIFTEYSYKYDLAEFRSMMETAGLAIERIWTDPHSWFAVVYCCCSRLGNGCYRVQA